MTINDKTVRKRQCFRAFSCFSLLKNEFLAFVHYGICSQADLQRHSSVKTGYWFAAKISPAC